MHFFVSTSWTPPSQKMKCPRNGVNFEFKVILTNKRLDAHKTLAFHNGFRSGEFSRCFGNSSSGSQLCYLQFPNSRPKR